jgi:hypothetical protein
VSFQTEHQLSGLPAIANLATDGAATGALAAFSEEAANAVDCGDIDALVVPAIPAVHAKVKAGPVVHRRRDRRRLVGGSRWKVSGLCNTGGQNRHRRRRGE